jgi:hypothetical protein
LADADDADGAPSHHRPFATDRVVERRKFNNFLGILQQAKRDTEEIKRRKKREEVEKRIQEKMKEEKDDLLRETEMQLEEKRKEEKEIRKRIAELKDFRDRAVTFIQSYSEAGFLQTTIQPCIFYSPSKMTEEEEKLVKERRSPMEGRWEALDEEASRLGIEHAISEDCTLQDVGDQGQDDGETLIGHEKNVDDDDDNVDDANVDANDDDGAEARDEKTGEIKDKEEEEEIGTDAAQHDKKSDDTKDGAEETSIEGTPE